MEISTDENLLEIDIGEFGLPLLQSSGSDLILSSEYVITLAFKILPNMILHKITPPVQSLDFHTVGHQPHWCPVPCVSAILFTQWLVKIRKGVEFSTARLDLINFYQTREGVGGQIHRLSHQNK